MYKLNLNGIIQKLYTFLNSTIILPQNPHQTNKKAKKKQSNLQN